jgi:hypothetical protein
MESQPIIDETTQQTEDVHPQSTETSAPADTPVADEPDSANNEAAQESEKAKPVKMAGWCFICKQKRKFEVVETKPTPRNPNTMVYMGPCPKKHKVDENFSYTKRHTVKEKDPETGEITVRRFAVQKKPRGYISTIRRLKADKKAKAEKADEKEAREVEPVAGSDDE